MNVLTKDIYQVLVNHMELMDIANLSKANPRLGKWLYPLFLKRLVYIIDFRIRKHFEYYQKIKLPGRENIGSYDNFVLAMQKSKALISGSCIVQIIKNEYYNTGINIYIEDNSIDYLGPILRSNHCYPYTIPPVDSDPNLKIIDKCEFVMHVPTGPLAEHFHRFKIITLDSDPEYYINNYLKFNIYKNWFYYDEKGPRIELTSLNDILNNTVTLKKSGDYSWNNIKKWIERTFSLN